MRTLESPRLILRPLSPNDEAFYCALYTDPQVMRHIAPPLSAALARRTFQSALHGNREAGAGDRCWVIVRRDNSSLAGVIGWHLLDQPDNAVVADIGAVLGRDAQGEGISVEAGNALMRYAFDELHFSAFITQHHIAHTYAALMMAKLRFQRHPPDNAETTEVIWRMSVERWDELHPKTVAVGP